MTLADAAEAMRPPIPRRELARRLKSVAAVGTQYARRGRPAALYPIAAIMRAHADWMRDVGARSTRVPEFGPSSPCADADEGVRRG
jgi:hypothetical protein